MKDYELIEKEIDGKIHYYAKFKDGQGIEQTTELDREVYSVIDNSQKEISSQARKDRRYHPNASPLKIITEQLANKANILRNNRKSCEMNQHLFKKL